MDKLTNDNISISFVKQFLIPFVNAKSDKEKLESFENIARKGIAFSLNMGQLVIDDSIKLDLNIEKVNQIHNIILKMLRIALVKGEFDKLYPGIKDINNIEEFTKLNDLELHIKKALKYYIENVCYYIWRGGGLSYVIYDIDLSKDFYLDIESIIIKLIFNIFESIIFVNGYDIETDQPTLGFISAIGYQYFAICPKCGKFFYKKRKDMIFDSEKCRGAERQKRHRIRNKE